MIKFTTEQVGEVLQRLQDSEFDFTLLVTWPGGVASSAGIHGGAQKATNALTVPALPDAVSELAFQVAVDHPNSEFSAWYANESAKRIAPGTIIE